MHCNAGDVPSPCNGPLFLTHGPGIRSNILIYDGGFDGQGRRKSSHLRTLEK